MKVVLKTIEKIADVIAGQSPPSTFYNKTGNGLPFFQGRTDFGDKYPIARSWCTNPIKISIKNDILMSVRAPVGPVNIANEESCIGRGIAAIRLKKEYDHRYLYYFLKENQHHIIKNSSGSTFKAITQKDIKKIPVLVPELIEDQKRIAKVLSQCEELIQKRKESIDLLNELIISFFLELFGDPRTNSKNWEIDSVIKYADCIVPARNKPKSFTGKIPWVTTTDLVNLGKTKKSKLNFGLTDDEISQAGARIIPKDSVIMTCVGDLGVVTIAETNMVINQQLHAFQCKEEMNNIFLMHVLSFQKYFMYKVASKTTVPYMNKANCNSIPIIKPPMELQLEFAQVFYKIDSIKKIFIDSLKELENLYYSIGQKAFNGELDLSKVDISDMEEFKKKDLEEVNENAMEETEYSLKKKVKLLEILNNEKSGNSYLSKNCLLYIENSKALRSKIYSLLEKSENNVSIFRNDLIELNKIGEQLQSEVKEYTPWQIDQHKSVERYISFLPENILNDYPNINLFSKNQFDYNSMTLDKYYGIPDEIIAQYGSIEDHSMDLDFFFRKYFSNKLFSSEDIEVMYNKVTYERGDWFKYDEMKNFVFLALEGDDALLSQSFEEIEIQVEESEKLSRGKKLMLKVIP